MVRSAGAYVVAKRGLPIALCAEIAQSHQGQLCRKREAAPFSSGGADFKVSVAPTAVGDVPYGCGTDGAVGQK